MDVQEHSPLPFDLFIGPGFAFDEIVLLDESIIRIVAHGGQLDAPHRAAAIPGHVLVGAEPVAGEHDADAEVGKVALLGEHGRGGELIPA